MTWQITRFPELSVESKKAISDWIQANYKEREQAVDDTYTYGLQAAFGSVSAAYWYSKALATIDRLDKQLNSLLTSLTIMTIDGVNYTTSYLPYIAEVPNLSSFKKTGWGTSNNDTDILGSKWANYTLRYLSGNDSVSVSAGGHRVFANLGSGNDFFQGNSGNDGVFGDIGDDKVLGGDGFDDLDGGDDNDFISGEADKDLIHGGLGDDILSGGAGDDFIDGGEGSDTAMYQANFDEYQIIFENGLLKIVDSTSTRDGSDRLTRIEYLQFNDIKKTVNLLPGAPNETPTALKLSASAFNENISSASIIATLSSADPDASNTFTYSLITGAGSTDNAAFTIVGNQLKINISPNYESKSSYTIRLRTTDQGGLSFDHQVTLAVLDVNEAAVNDGAAAFAVSGTAQVGQVLTVAKSVDDPDGNGSFTYQWQASTNGSNWSNIGTNAST